MNSDNKPNMYTISYIAHCKRMYKAQIREKRLKGILILSNILWLILAVLIAVVR